MDIDPRSNYQWKKKVVKKVLYLLTGACVLVPPLGISIVLSEAMYWASLKVARISVLGYLSSFFEWIERPGIREAIKSNLACS